MCGRPPTAAIEVATMGDAVWRGTDEGGWFVPRHRHCPLHARGFSLHHQGRRALCDRTRLADEGGGDDSLTRSDCGPIRTKRVTVGQRSKADVPAASRWIARATACAAAD